MMAASHTLERKYLNTRDCLRLLDYAPTDPTSDDELELHP